MKRILLVTFLGLTLAACGDDGGPEIPEFDGRWQGAMGSVVVTVTASENDDGVLNGSGTMSVGTESIAFSFDGIHAHPDVSFTGTASGFEDFNFSGEFTDDDTIHGSLSGSGFSGEALVLRRD